MISSTLLSPWRPDTFSKAHASGQFGRRFGYCSWIANFETGELGLLTLCHQRSVPILLRSASRVWLVKCSDNSEGWCRVAASQWKHQSLSANATESCRSSLEDPRRKSSASVLVELSVALVKAASVTSTPGFCSRCQSYRDPRLSTALYRNLFCSQQCEQEFVRTALESVTLEECDRIQEKLNALLIGARESSRTGTASSD